MWSEPSRPPPLLKTDLDIRPVYHKSDDGIKAPLNLAMLAFWVVGVTKYRLKVKGHNSVRWEIMRIASTQTVVTAKVETEEGRIISIRQSTEAESVSSSSLYLSLCGQVHPGAYF